MENRDGCEGLVSRSAQPDDVGRRAGGTGATAAGTADAGSRHCGLAEAAARFGSGIVELTRRANVQLRGIRNHAGLLQALDGLGLLDADPMIEARRNILVSPLWRPGDITERLALELEGRAA